MSGRTRQCSQSETEQRDRPSRQGHQSAQQQEGCKVKKSDDEAQTAVRQLARPGLSQAGASYLRGRLLALRLRQVDQGTPRARIVRELAAELQIEVKVLRADARFARAVD